MAALICGSLAFDTIANFEGRFGQQILADKIHILNVSFLVPTLRREFGGCAGNIAYTLSALGGQARVLAAVGSDGGAYLQRMNELGIDTRHVLTVADAYTAQAHIMTDLDNNQITAFHPGAMQQAHRIDIPAERGDIKVAIVAPDGREGMLRHTEQLAAAGVPFIFDPGQQLPQFDGTHLLQMVQRAAWVTLNDYEAHMLTERCGQSLAQLSSLRGLQGIVVTLAHEGCEVWSRGQATRVPGVAAAKVVDPTGCGDAFRAALLYGLERGWPLVRCAELGNKVGAVKIASHGTQNFALDRTALGL